MPVLKLSQIAASAANFADGDSIVTVQSSAVDVRLTRTQLFGFPTLQLGSSDAAAPVAQTLQVQSVVAGTSNTAGVDWTFVGSKGTGTGAGGSIIFKTAPAGTTGTAQNTPTTVLTIASNQITTPAPQTASGSVAITNDASGQLFSSLIVGGSLRCYGNGGPANGAMATTNGLASSRWLIIGAAGMGTAPSGMTGLNTALIFSNGTNASFDTYLFRAAAATLQQGDTDAAAPVAQTLKVQSVVAGTSNTAGVDWTFVGSKGTGSGKGGNIIFQVAPCSSGTGATAQNPVQTGLSITASSVATFTQQPSVVIGSSQLNSSAVEGFLYIPTVNGPPTGTPTTYTGRVPIVFDSSNNKLYIFNSSGAAWVGGTVPGAWS